MPLGSWSPLGLQHCGESHQKRFRPKCTSNTTKHLHHQAHDISHTWSGGFCSLWCAAPDFPKDADHPHRPRCRFPRSRNGEPIDRFKEIRTDLVFEGPPFQQRLWQLTEGKGTGFSRRYLGCSICKTPRGKKRPLKKTLLETQWQSRTTALHVAAPLSPGM